MRNRRFGDTEASSIMWTVSHPGLHARGPGETGVPGGDGQVYSIRGGRRREGTRQGAVHWSGMTMKQPMAAAYVRVSALDQNDSLQRDAISRWAAANGVELSWYADAFTGKTMDRPDWNALWRRVETGEIARIVTWKMDRLGRTASGLASLFENMLDRHVDFQSLTEGVDLATASGRLMAHILASVAEYEREVRGERQHAGIEAARRRNGGRCPWGGSLPGVPKSLTAEQVEHIRLAKADGQGVTTIARTIGCSRQTVYRVLSWSRDSDNRG